MNGTTTSLASRVPKHTPGALPSTLFCVLLGLAFLVLCFSPSSAQFVRDEAIGCGVVGCVDPIVDPLTGADFFVYAPAEAVPQPWHELTVFHPEAPAPPNGYPTVISYSSGTFAESIADCDRNRGPHAYICEDFRGDLRELLDRGWAVISVNTVGVKTQTPSINVFHHYEPDAVNLTAWEDPTIFWGEKEAVWARQWVAHNADLINVDNSKVVVCGTSSGSEYGAYVALGPKREFLMAVAESQSAEDTRCAGYVGYASPAWFPIYTLDFQGIHWENDLLGGPANTLAEVDPADLAATSISHIIREKDAYASDTPIFLAYDEAVWVNDFDRDPSTGDPLAAGLTDVGNGDPLHPSWTGLILKQDLLALDQDNDEDPYFHANNSVLAFSELILTLSISGPLGTETFDDLDQEIQDLVDDWFPDDLKGRAYSDCALNWLAQFTDSPRVSKRADNANADVYSSCHIPELGKSWSAEVDVSSFSNPTLVTLFSSGFAVDPTPFGSLGNVLIVPVGQYYSLMTFPVVAGSPSVSLAVDLPRGSIPVGQVFYTQVLVSAGSGTTQLTNALDLRPIP